MFLHDKFTMFILFVLAAVATLVTSTDLPQNTSDVSWNKLPACKEASPTLNKCIQDSLNQIIPTLAVGWEGEGGLDPLDLEPRSKTCYADGNMSLCLETRSVTIMGLTSGKIHAVKSKNLYMGKLELVMKIPWITAIGKYSTEGIISTFPVSSAGEFNVTMNEVTVVWIIWLDRYRMDKESKRLGINNLSLDAAPEQIHIQPAPSLDGNSSLGKTLEVYLNQNSYELYNMIKDPLMKWMSNLAKDLVDSYLAKVPDSRILRMS